MYTSKAIAAVDYKKVIKGILDSWLRQAENCNMKLIESYRTDSGFEIFFLNFCSKIYNLIEKILSVEKSMNSLK